MREETKKKLEKLGFKETLHSKSGYELMKRLDDEHHLWVGIYGGDKGSYFRIIVGSNAQCEGETLYDEYIMDDGNIEVFLKKLYKKIYDRLMVTAKGLAELQMLGM